MKSRLNLICAIGIVGLNALVWTSLFMTPSYRAPGRVANPWQPVMRILVPLLIGWTVFGIVVFIVDAFRRSHVSERGTPIGLAIAGIITFGLSSLLYYLLYARSSLRPAEEIYGQQFCARCLTQTTDQPAPSTYTHNFVVGTMLLGNADPCPDCKSRIQTLWAFVLIPLAPTGSYRVIATGPGQYVGRRTSHLNLRQVLLTYATGLALGGPLVAWMIYSAWNRGAS